MSDPVSSRRTVSPRPSTVMPPPVRASGDDQPTVISRASPAEAAGEPVFIVDTPRLEAGERLGHFELLEYIGGGGMGRVFRAMDHRLARIVAVKVLLPDQASDTETLLRFHNEARSAAKLDHENIARVYYVGEDRGLPFIVFEYVEGANIRDLVEQGGPLELGEAVNYTLQVAEALTHAAERDVVHRDIKPSNVQVTSEGRAKLIDLGLARLQTAPGDDLTASGVTLGTFDYISPEQARDPRTVDVRGDIYSLGCTFFFMLTGRPPFPEGTVLQKLLQHQGDQPPDVREFRPELPEEVSRVLRRMLAKDPKHRYQTPTALVEDLLDLAERLGLHPTGPMSRVWTVPLPPQVGFWERHLPWLAPVTALVCIVLLLDFLWSSPRATETTIPPPQLAEGPRGLVLRAPQPGVRTPSSPAPAAASSSHAVPRSAPSAQAALVSPASPPKQEDVATPPAAVPAPAANPAERPVGNALVPAAVALLDTSLHGASLRLESAQEGIGPAASREGLSAAGGQQPAGLVSGEAGIGGASAVSLVPPAARNRSGVIVVTDQPKGEREFASLSAACAMANSGDVIELRYNGFREERPVTLANVRITIHAGAGYTPGVRFRPSEMDPVRYRRSMFALSGGRLQWMQVDVQLELPREVSAENWSLFDLQGGQTLRMEHCRLTIRNASDQLGAYHPNVAFFRVRAPMEAGAGLTPVPAEQPASVELVNTVVRGEAAIVHAEELQPLRLLCENGLLATSEQLLVADGSPLAQPAGDLVELELRHVTLGAARGMCLCSTSPAAPHPRRVQVFCADSILVGGAGTALIEHAGLDREAAARQGFSWNGDRNFYESWSVFWRVRESAADSVPLDWSFEQWRAHWGIEGENLPVRAQVGWQKGSPPEGPFHLRTPADYQLRADSANPACGAASDDRDAGLLSERLDPFLRDSNAL